jgi:site-specific DNA-methyltransferase (adenine-specific)
MIDKMAGAGRVIVRERSYEMTDGGGYSGNLNTSKPRSESSEISLPSTPEAEQWDGWGTALGPSHEPIVVARKPLIGTVVKNVLTHGTGAINIDGCRISGIKDVPASPRRAEQGPAYGDLSADPGTGSGWDPHTGRWPKNTILSHHEDCVEVGTRKLKVVGATAHKMEHSTEGIAHSSLPHEHAGFRDDDGTETIPAYQCVEGCPVAELDAQSGNVKGFATQTDRKPWRGHGASPDVYGVGVGFIEPGLREGYNDSGGASRFFYQAKSSKRDRNYGMPEGEKNAHPTVKPIKLMQYLVRLVTQPGGTVLDPFAGSGTCGIAAIREGFDYIGIEQDPEYAVLAATRIKFAMNEKKQEGTL